MIFKEVNKMNFKQFKNYLSKSKKESDPFVSKRLYRPLSLFLGWILYRYGFTANSISFLSIILGLISCLCYVTGNYTFSILGSILILFVGITDCIDGNIARASNQLSLRGSWLDAFSSYFLAAFLPICIGIYTIQNYSFFLFEGDWILLGALMSINNILARLIYQKFSNLILSSSSSNSLLISKNSYSLSLSSEIGLVGWMAPLLIFCTYFDCLNLYLFSYTVFYILSLIFIFFRLYNKLID